MFHPAMNQALSISLALCAACAGNRNPGGDALAEDAGAATDAVAAERRLPPANAGLDYQLGGAYPPAADVGVLSRDRSDPPAAGVYNICYVNGFQTQPAERAWWTTNHPDLVLRDGTGSPVIDPDWPDEYILDISSVAKRAQIAEIVGAWLDGCAAAGFQAIEVDNLDTFTRFPRLAEADAVALARAYADRAHARGLAMGQKNTAELLGRRADAALDFAVVEQCNEIAGECQRFIDAYGAQVYLIEYARDSFQRGCAAFPQVSIVLRDVKVTPPGSSTYVREGC